VDDLWATKSEDVGVTVRAISSQDFQPICGHDPTTSQTDGWTDRRTGDMRSPDRALQSTGWAKMPKKTAHYTLVHIFANY